jgi:hypothetical protein
MVLLRVPQDRHLKRLTFIVCRQSIIGDALVVGDGTLFKGNSILPLSACRQNGNSQSLSVPGTERVGFLCPTFADYIQLL